MNNIKRPIGLYIHVPFCLSKCPYCDFYSMKYSRKTAADYKAAVLRNMDKYNGETFDTVYFGGGTPMLLWEEICEIISRVRPWLTKDAEITVEANPDAATEKMLLSLYNAGVNRISFGVQSAVDSELSKLGRKHTAKQAENAISTAFSIGFENISADLMLAVPGQTLKSMEYSISFLSALPITHISAYLLKIEEGTPFASAKLILPDEDMTDNLYLSAVNLLGQQGFKQYEISNFARFSSTGRHNLKYWECNEYVGIGPGAHSYFGGKRFAVPRDIKSFLESEIQPVYVTEEAPHDFYEWAMLGLRLTKGIAFSQCEQFGISRQMLISKTKLIPPQYLNLSEVGISLTPEGFLVSNAIIGKLLDF